LEALINPVKKDAATGRALLGPDGQPIYKYKNATLPQQMIKLLMWGQVTTGFTGRQGSGKTTMMVAAISQVDARFNIRVLEMAPEMYLREIYTQRNILSVAETPTVDAAMLQDALKKSDAALSIVGEVATDVIAARMIQMGQVASIFTIFSHHANRTVDLVHALTNSIVSASGGSATPQTVEPQVIDVIKVDCHLDYDVNGNRYIERITEIIRLDSVPYPEWDKENLEILISNYFSKNDTLSKFNLL
jgi:pilus assembly protein CpaF